MHTLLFSKRIGSDDYYNILNSIPHTVVEHSDSSKFRKFRITTEKLQTDGESDLPEVYLVNGEKKNKKNKKIYKYYMAEILVDCSRFLDSDSYCSVDAAGIFMWALSSVIGQICRAIPQLDNLHRIINYEGHENSIWSILWDAYESVYPDKAWSYILETPSIMRATASKALQILAELAESDSQRAKETLQALFSTPQFTRDLDRNRMLFYIDYPPDFVLKRIDYTFDMYTDYKQIYLELVTKGYGLARGKDRVYRSGTENEAESLYIKLKSYRINIYDKMKQLNDKGRAVEDDGKAGKLLRFEVQAERGKIDSELKKMETDRSGKMLSGMSDFISYEMEHEMLEYYFKKIIGTGNYYTITAAKEIVNASGHKKSMKEKLNKVLGHVARRGSIKNFLECVGKGEITDCGKVQTAGEYLKKLHELGVNPVTISREQQSRMKAVKRETEPDIPQIAFRYPKYRYGIDFLPSPLWKLIFKKKVHDADRGNFGSSSTHIDFTELKNF